MINPTTISELDFRTSPVMYLTIRGNIRLIPAAINAQTISAINNPRYGL
jgi:hypothetical protein